MANDRRGRYRLLNYLRTVSVRNGAKLCMRSMGSTVSLSATAAGVVRVGGVSRCGSVWACPVCAPVIRETRAVEIDQALHAHLAAGGSAFFVTATVRHSAGTPLADVLSIVGKSWTGANNRKSQRGDILTGTIRAIEVTHGRNGWHPHVHALMLFAPGVAESAARSYLANLSTHWSHELGKRGASCGSKGFDVRPVHDVSGASSYLTKVDGGWGAGLELARGDVKLAHGKGTTPQEFLSRAMDGDFHSLKMWLHYERATKGKMAIRWSPGLKALYAIEEVSDEEIFLDPDDSEPDTAAAEVTPTDPVVLLAIVPSVDWDWLLLNGEAAEMIEQLGRMALRQPYLWRWPIDWVQFVATPQPLSV